MRLRKTDETGFTLVELLIATMVFSVILLLATAAMLQIGRVYYKGVIDARTQETSRSIMDDIAQAIQFSGASVQPLTPAGSVKGFCVDNNRYSYLVNKQLEPNPVTSGPLLGTQSKHVFVVDNVGAGCGSAPFNKPQQLDNPVVMLTPSSKELVGQHMRLGNDPMPISAGSLYTVYMTVVYGDQDVLGGAYPNYLCKSIRFGGQFCSVSPLSTTVKKRIQ